MAARRRRSGNPGPAAVVLLASGRYTPSQLGVNGETTVWMSLRIVLPPMKAYLHHKGRRDHHRKGADDNDHQNFQPDQAQ